MIDPYDRIRNKAHKAANYTIKEVRTYVVVEDRKSVV